MARFIKGQIPWNKGTARTATCIVCNVVYRATERKPTTKYCSNKCKYSDRTWNIQQAEKIRGRVGPWAGKKRLSMRGELNVNWKGGNRGIRTTEMGRVEYKEWRRAVFQRDDYTCQDCGVTNLYLHADHKIDWSKDESLRYDIDNGQTLCYKCHYRKTFGRFTEEKALLWGVPLKYRKVG